MKKEKVKRIKKERKPLSNWIKFPLILGAIASISGCLIGGTYFLVKETIKQNLIDLENKNLDAIYSSDAYEITQIPESDVVRKDSSITKIWEVKSKTDKDEPLKYIYRADKSNSYGHIDLLAGIEGNDGKISKVILLENSESFAKEVNSWVDENNKNNFDNIDTHCGATFGAETIKSMLLEIQEDYLNRIKVENGQS